ncbi:MAG TPA: response regulator [Rariglobus sp.]
MNPTLHVLLVEDSDDDAQLLILELTRGGHKVVAKRVETADALRAALAEGSWQVVLCDFTLPHFSGEAALRIVKESGIDLPFIYVSGTMGEDIAVQAMKAGAHDYILKQSLARLVPAIERELREAQDRKHGREAEEQMRMSEHKYRHLFKSMRDAALLVAEESDRVIDANEEAEKLLGFQREALLGMKHAQLYRQPPSGAHGACYEAEVLRADGGAVPVHVCSSTIELYEHPCTLTLLRDISERRLLEDQFRQAQKMEAIGRLAGGIAHDFNNLLAVIQMQSSLLLMDTSATPALMREGINQIMAASERAARLTRQLLTFSRRSVRQSADIDLGEVTGNMTKLLRSLLGEDVLLETRFAPSLPLVNADPGMMEQVVMNLAVNARDAMPDGGRLLIALDAKTVGEDHLRAHPQARTGVFVCLSVTDTGSGIAKEDLPHIFEPFFTTKAVGKGTGLGLATVFGIVEQHHGWIEVESVVGKGTTFRAYLPALSISAATAATVPKPLVRGGDETILLVEDEDALRTLAGAVLERQGYHVLTAGTAAEAIKRWDEHRAHVDLLLTDLIMPGGMSGDELADELVLRQPGLKVIFTSGYSNDLLQQRSHLRPGVDFIAKPYPVSDLAVIVRRRLDESDAAVRFSSSAGS